MLMTLEVSHKTTIASIHSGVQNKSLKEFFFTMLPVFVLCNSRSINLDQIHVNDQTVMFSGIMAHLYSIFLFNLQT